MILGFLDSMGWQTVCQALIAGIVTIILAIIGARTKKAVETTAKEAAKKVVEVVNTVKKTSDDAAIQVAEVKVATDDAAKKVAEVKIAFEENNCDVNRKLDAIAETNQAVHTLVNSAMGEQKKLLAVTARSLADRTHSESDQQIADMAEKELAQHVAKQSIVDSHGEGYKG